MHEFTQRTGLSVIEVSAKSGQGVESSFIALTEALCEQNIENGSSTQDEFDNKIKMKKINRGGLT
jgi:hypothetical protein